MTRFAERFPDRVWDVGIAEQHATVSAAGLATGGLHPVVALYATFLNRAFDQLLMDVALHRCGVTFVLDRAGVTGSDGPSHNGMWDMSVLQCVPGLRSPRRATPVSCGRSCARPWTWTTHRPWCASPRSRSARRYRLSDASAGWTSCVARTAKTSCSCRWACSQRVCLKAAELLAERGIGCTVVDPRWVKPVDEQLPPLAARHRLVAVVEDNSRSGGVGWAVGQSLRDAGVDVPLRTFGIPEQFLAHAKRSEVLADIGLTPVEIAGRISAALAHKESTE